MPKQGLFFVQSKCFNDCFLFKASEECIRQAEETGRRTFEWRLSSFDTVGGYNTLRKVRAKLRGVGRVSGKKRSAV